MIPLLFVATIPLGAASASPDDGLVGYWKLTVDCRDSSGQANHGTGHGVQFTDDQGATFDGIDDYVEVPDSQSLQFGTADFSIAVWIHTEAQLDDVLGDVLSKYNPADRRGWTLCLQDFSGVTTSHSNQRNLLFGIDAGRIDPQWTDCGRPGNSQFVFALAVHDGCLYAGTFEWGEDEAGHVYRYDGGTEWIDCGSPDPCNSVACLAAYQGNLYAGVMHYTAGGSALPESPNKKPGGKVYRYEGGKRWVDCGKIADSPGVSGLVVFQGKLYAAGHFLRPAQETCKMGLYRYDGERQWTFCGHPGYRVSHLAVYNGHIYTVSYDGCRFARYEGGTSWTPLGPIRQSGQSYSVAVHQGRMVVGTWPQGEVFRYDGPQKWAPLGQLGEEQEVMGMAVYNGKLYAGTLPLAAVYRYDGDTNWTFTGRLDTTPDVKYRRVWSMAVYDGKLFAGTLPSGHVLCLEAGKAASDDRALAPGWRHVAAVKQAGRLKLYVDGKCVATSSEFDAADYDLSNHQPLQIGFGQHDYFNGKMRDFRIYSRALSDGEIQTLGQQR